MGIAGKAVTEGSRLRTIRDISSLNIRLAHEKPGCGDPVLPWLYENGRLQNTLILSPPGAGKTTLLRDVVRQVSNGNRYGPVSRQRWWWNGQSWEPALRGYPSAIWECARM